MRRLTTQIKHLTKKLPTLAVSALAITLGTVGIVVNARYYGALGNDPWLIVLGGVIDLLGMFLPTIGNQQRTWATRGIAYGLWFGAIVMTLLATAGWSASNIGDGVAKRSIEATSTSSTVHRLETLDTERAAIKEARSVAMIEAAMHQHGCKKQCKLELTEAKATAARRDDLDKELIEARASLKTVDAVSAADAGAEMVAGWLHVPATWVSNARLIGLTVLIPCAGLLLSLAFGVAKVAKPRKKTRKPAARKTAKKPSKPRLAAIAI